MALKILMASGGIAQTNCFLAADEEARVAVLFDAPDHTVGPLLDHARAQGWELAGLWLTHGHFDHIADHAEVKKAFGNAKALVHSLDAPMLADPHGRLPWELPFVISPLAPDGLLADGEVLRIGAHRAVVLHTPGHSPGHVCFHFPESELLIGGDLIIGGSVGRTDIPGADPDAMNRSLRRIMALPLATKLMPGHGEPSTLAQEARENEYVARALAGG